MRLPHASGSIPRWRDAHRRTGRLVVLLDFDGTLAPLVSHPGEAAIPPATRAALDRLRAIPGVDLALVSGRALADLRERAALPGVVHAGNHGLEMAGDGWRWSHPDAAAARPMLDLVADEIAPTMDAIDGAWTEDKGLTLTVHHRLAPPASVPTLRSAVAAAVARHGGVRMTEGKSIFEVRPDVDWDKGRADLFLLGRLRPPAGAPILYLGDDVTDEDAFRALRASTWAGIIVAGAPRETAASCFVRDVEEVGGLLAAMAE
jgi:trehalose 6-phosphate phosphatase